MMICRCFDLDLDLSPIPQDFAMFRAAYSRELLESHLEILSIFLLRSIPLVSVLDAIKCPA